MKWYLYAFLDYKIYWVDDFVQSMILQIVFRHKKFRKLIYFRIIHFTKK